MNKNSKSLLITGSEGLVGKYLVKHLEKLYRIVKLDLTLKHDLTNEDFVRNWFQKNKNLYGMIVCHAYNPVPKSDSKKVEPTEVSLKEIRDYLEVNTVSVFNLCQHFIKNNTQGRIILLSSIYGKVSPRHSIYQNYVKPIGYSISKSALCGLVKYIAAYYAPQFLINSLILGGIYDPKLDKKFIAKYSENTPIGRMMRIEEITPLIDFLLDTKATYATGSEYYYDGGWTAW